MVEKRLDEMSEKMDKLVETNHEQNIQLERLTIISEQNTKILDEHARRSTASEKRIEQTEERVSEVESKFVKHLNDLDKKLDGHFSFLKGAGWTFGTIFSLLSAVALLDKIGWI